MNAERNNAGSSAAPGEPTGGGGDPRHSPPNQQQHPSQQQHHHQQQQQQQQIHIRHSVSSLGEMQSFCLFWLWFHGQTLGRGAALSLFIFFLPSGRLSSIKIRKWFLSLLCVFVPASAVGRPADRGRCYPASRAGKFSCSHKRFMIVGGRGFRNHKVLGIHNIIVETIRDSVGKWKPPRVHEL